MPVLQTIPLSNDTVKMRWKDPFVTASLNQKFIGSLSKGVLTGFNVVPKTGFTVSVQLDPQLGLAVANVLETTGGKFSVSVVQNGIVDIDLTAQAGTTVYIVLDVQYVVGATSAAQIKVVDAVEAGFAAYKSGIGDTISGTPPTMSLSDGAGTFAVGDVGNILQLFGATTAANNGRFLITSFTSAAQIGYSNAAGAAEAFPGNYGVYKANDFVLLAKVNVPGVGPVLASHINQGWRNAAGDSSPPEASPHFNLVHNPTFEATAAGWVNSGFDSVTASTDFAKTGTYSLKLVKTVAGIVSVSAGPMPVVPGRNYRASIWMHSPAGLAGGNGGKFQVGFFDASGAQIGGWTDVEAAIGLATGFFVDRRLEVIAPALAHTAKIRLLFDNCSGTLYLDDVEFSTHAHDELLKSSVFGGPGVAADDFHIHTASGLAYGGSPNWADGSNIPAGTIEAGLDAVPTALGGASGAAKIGFSPSTPVDLTATRVDNAINELDDKKAGLAQPNNFTRVQTINPSPVNESGLIAYGKGTGSFAGVAGSAVHAEHAGSGPGVYATGGASGGASAHGVFAATASWAWPSAAGGPYGVVGVGGDDGGYGYGVVGVGSSPQGGTGVLGLGSENTSVPVDGDQHGVVGVGGSGSNGSGVIGRGGSANGIGVRGEGNGSGAAVRGVGGTNATASVTAGLGGWFTGAGGAYGGDGVRAEGGATGRSGVFGLGATGGTGLWGQGTTTGIGVRGFGGATNAHGVEGTGGGTTSSGVVGYGKGNGAGVQGLGQDNVSDGGTSAPGGYFEGGNTNPGQSFYAGGFAGTGVVSVGGVGATDTGGASWTNGGNGITSTGGDSGGLGDGGHGIKGTGGQGQSFSGYGVWGVGGLYPPTDSTFQRGAYGGRFVGGATYGTGLLAEKAAGDATNLAYAADMNGEIRFINAGTYATTFDSAHLIGRKNHIAVWAYVTTAIAANGTVNDGWGVASETASGNFRRLNFAHAMANTNYFATVESEIGSGFNMWIPTRNASYVEFQGYNTTSGATFASGDWGGRKYAMLVVGIQT